MRRKTNTVRAPLGLMLSCGAVASRFLVSFKSPSRRHYCNCGNTTSGEDSEKIIIATTRRVCIVDILKFDMGLLSSDRVPGVVGRDRKVPNVGPSNRVP